MEELGAYLLGPSGASWNLTDDGIVLVASFKRLEDMHVFVTCFNFLTQGNGGALPSGWQKALVP